MPRHVFAILLLLVVPASAVAADDQPPPAGAWFTGFGPAEAEARRLNVPLLVHFYADWCLPCKRMEREALVDDRLVRNFGRRIVGVKVNFEGRKDLALRFNVRNLPNDVILAPDGTVLAQSHGYRSAQKYLQQLAAADSRFQQIRNIARSPQREGTAADGLALDSAPSTLDSSDPLIVARPTSRQKPQPENSRPTRTVTVPKPSIGLDGYNPVALFERRTWQKGDEAFAALYKGIQYNLNTPADLRKFLKHPQQFAPNLLGCDAVLLHETDRALNGSARHAAYFDGRLYLFVNAETRIRFKQNPLRYTQTLHVLLLEAPPEKQTIRR